MSLYPLGDADDLRRRRDRQTKEIEEGIEEAADAAMRQFLRRVLDRTTPSNLRAAANPSWEQPWAPTSKLMSLGEVSGWWEQAIDDNLSQAVQGAWFSGYQATSDLPILSTSADAAATYIANVKDRLSRTATPTVPEAAFDKVRGALAQETARGSSIGETSQRLAAEFGWDEDATFWRGRRAELDGQIDRILDPIGAPGDPAREAARLNDPVVRELQAQRSEAVLHTDRVQSEWQTRSERIARTESTAAYNSGALDAGHMEGAKVKVWLATADERTRESHLEASNACSALDDDFLVGESYLAMPGDPSAPPAETVNCRAVLPGTRVRGDVLVAMKRPWSGPTRIIETASGHRLAATPEHPVLTGRGWLAAGDVEVGDKCIGDPLDVEGAGSRHLRGVDEQHRMTTVEEVHETLALASLRGEGRRGYARDLDDDGSHVQVDVVAADHPLAFGLDAEEAQRLGDLGVSLSHREMCATDDPATLVRVSHPHVPGFRPAAGDVSDLREPGRKDRPGYPEVGRDPVDGLSRLMSSDDLVEVDLVSAAAPGAAHRLRAGADNSRLPQVLVGPGEAASGRIRDLLERGSFRVHLDEVVSVRDGWWDRHVYDLTTVGGMLVTDGIVTHNCTVVFAASCTEAAETLPLVDEKSAEVRAHLEDQQRQHDAEVQAQIDAGEATGTGEFTVRDDGQEELAVDHEGRTYRELGSPDEENKALEDYYRRHPDGGFYNDEHTRLFETYTEGIPADEVPIHRQSAMVYQGGDYAYINGTHRGVGEFNIGLDTTGGDGSWNQLLDKSAGASVREVSQRLDRMIEAAPRVPENLQVFRGVEGSYANVVRDAPVGTLLHDKGYISTTVNARTADTFGRGGRKLVVEVPEGSQALYINSLSDSGLRNEMELVLARGGQMEVIEQTSEHTRVRLVGYLRDTL